MKVCIVSSTFPLFEGDTRPAFVYNFAKTIAKQGLEVHVVTPWGTITGEKMPQMEEEMDSISVHRFNYFIPKSCQKLVGLEGMPTNILNSNLAKTQIPTYIVAGALKSLSVAKEYKCDILHAMWSFPQGLMCLPAKYLLKKPLVISAYGADIYLAERYKIKKWVEWILNRSDAIVVNSEATENAVKTVGARKKSQIIYWGVDTERYNPKTRDKTKIKRTKSRYGIQGGKIILFAGRLIERKGVEYLVRAIPEIRKNIKDFNLVIVGGGPLEKELKKLAKELGITSYVVFTGRISDEELLQFYHMCDVFVLPAIVDSKGDTEGGQGLVTKEAMACEKPVVVSGVGGIPDLIQHGKTGILVKEKNPQELAEAITTILNDKTLADRISKSGRKLIEREASWDVTCRGYFRLYEKLSAF